MKTFKDFINQKGFSIIVLLAIVGMLVAVAGGAYYYQQQNNTSENTDITPTPTTISEGEWKTYVNEDYGFSFEYPGSWIIYRNQVTDDFIAIGISNYDAQLYPTRSDSIFYDVPTDYTSISIFVQDLEDIPCEFAHNTQVYESCIFEGQASAASNQYYEYLGTNVIGQNKYHVAKIIDLESRDRFELYLINYKTKKIFRFNMENNPEKESIPYRILNSINFTS